MTVSAWRIAVSFWMAGFPVGAQPPSLDVPTFLHDRLGFGEVVSRVLATTDPEEMAISVLCSGARLCLICPNASAFARPCR